MSGGVVLIGASGAGKSTVGPLLARALDRPFVDVDAAVEAAAGRSIAALFAAHGEAHFRVLEADAALAALSTEAVVSLGGGAPLTPAVADALAGHRVVWLQVAPEAAAARVAHHTDRPLLAGDRLATLRRMVAERSAVYARLADVAVATDGLVPDAVAARVLTALEDLA